MKNKTTILIGLLLTIIISGFGFQSTQVPQQAKVPQDSIRKAAIADSLKVLRNLKLKFYKKNAHASYYAAKFNGRRTASGRKFDNNKYTAAHRKFPFGTKLKVTNEANGKSVIVEVIDRGPFAGSREIDLTSRAFFEIAGKNYGGSIKVTIEVVLP
jgi:rare lipoprotein A